MEGSRFGHPASWADSDLIGASLEFDPELVLEAYRCGVFPMPLSAEELPFLVRCQVRGRPMMGWYSPLRRGVLPLDGLLVSRSLRKMRPRYEIRVDSAFEAVLDGCGRPDRPGGWIDDRIRTVYGRLHRDGVVHTVEAWTADGELAGGLYGVSVGGLFAGESMFHRPDVGRDASKVALVALVELLDAAGGPDRLLDVQWRTPHLASLGAVEIDRTTYLARLAAALRTPAPDWAAAAQSVPGR